MKLPLPKLTLKDHHRLMWWVTSLDEVLPTYEHAEYRGHTLKKTADNWLLVVRVTKGGRPLVSFYTEHRPWACWMRLAIDIKHHKVFWKVDKPRKSTGG